MKFNKINNNSFMILYEEDKSTLGEEMYSYLAVTENKILLCDTHLGPKSMEPIEEFIKNKGFEDKEMWIFNSHFHWDHIWGNCAFKKPKIVAHKLCKKLMDEKGKNKLKEKSDFQMGEVELVLPNITFDQKLELTNEHFEFLHTPSHTEDSSICIDRKNSVMYVGDVIEFPFPFIQTNNLEKYIETLEELKKMDIDTIICSHSGIVSEKLIDKNIKYIKQLLEGKAMNFKDELSKVYHQYNKEFLNNKEITND